MNFVLYRKVLGRQTERVPTHGVEYAVSLHALHAGIDVGSNISLWMPDVKPLTRGIRKHVQHIALGLCDIALCTIHATFCPNLLPFFLYLFMVILCHGESIITPPHHFALRIRNLKDVRNRGSISTLVSYMVPV